MMTILGWCVKEYPSHNLCNGWMIMENDGAPVEACKCLCHNAPPGAWPLREKKKKIT